MARILTNHEKWVELFREAVESPREIEILQTIDLGYLSDVYLISINHTQFAVKMYHERYTGSNICMKEHQHILRARKTVPASVPQPFFCSKHTDNSFHREILVMKRAFGVPLSKNVFNDRVFEALVAILTQLHSTQVLNEFPSNEIMRIEKCRRTMTHFLKKTEIIPQKRVIDHLSALREYYIQNQVKFNRQKTVIHGDLWWDNLLVDDENVMMIDWLDSDEQDYCRDLAQFKIGTLNEVLNPTDSQTYFEKTLKIYGEIFDDDTIIERMHYHLPLMYLEEAFYLPFKFFPWEIKYQENENDFENRFLDYYDRSERSFVNVLAS
jgi:fructosamine-3-kinase